MSSVIDPRTAACDTSKGASDTLSDTLDLAKPQVMTLVTLVTRFSRIHSHARTKMRHLSPYGAPTPKNLSHPSYASSPQVNRMTHPIMTRHPTCHPRNLR